MISLQHLGMAHVQRVAGAGVIHVVARIVGDQPVISGVIDAAEADSVGPIWLPSAVWL